MTQLCAIAGNDDVKEALAKALQVGSLAHAVLLAAPDGCGRNFAARCLMADYLYPAGGAGAAAVMRGESSEVLCAEGEGKSGQIPVARIRAIRADIFRSSLSAAGRAVHIRDAHNMAAPAANALLKVLEEPPADALFVLTAASPALLPVTIVSRCAVYSLAPVPAAQCQALLQNALLQGANARLPALLTALYGGRCGLGLAALKDPARLAVVTDALLGAAAAAKGDTYALLALLAKYEGRADGDREKRDALLADMICALDAVLNGRTTDELPRVSAAKAARLLALLQATRDALKGNAAPKLAFTAMGVQMARVAV